MIGTFDPVRGKSFHAGAADIHVARAKRIDAGIFFIKIKSLPEIIDVLCKEDNAVRITGKRGLGEDAGVDE